MPKTRKCWTKNLHDPHLWRPIAYPSFGKRSRGSRNLTVVDYWCTGRNND